MAEEAERRSSEGPSSRKPATPTIRSGSAASPQTSISCERCRKRKIKCDRRYPCSKCRAASTECFFPGGGERSKPAPRRYVQSLENRIASLETLLQKAATASDTERYELLNCYGAQPPVPLPAQPQQPIPSTDTGPSQFQRPVPIPPSPLASELSTSGTPTGSSPGELVAARAREGRMMCKKTSSRKATRFYGGTSLYQLSVSEAKDSAALGVGVGVETSPSSGALGLSPLPAPRDRLCCQLMAVFFQNVYHYNMCIYREYFLRDFDAGSGPYYSDALMYAICAVGALIRPVEGESQGSAAEKQYQQEGKQQLASALAAAASSLVLESLDMPDLTTLQALVVLAHFEIGQGRSSKGWLFCGMACRLTHEMGLHLDPTNWTSKPDEAFYSSTSVDREILRRVYWAVFVADKQLSLYFGRPPALCPRQADVRNTIRIPYPAEWESLLDTYICAGTSAAAFEDGIGTVGALVHQIELAKIFHVMIVDVFEDRNRFRRRRHYLGHPAAGDDSAAPATNEHGGENDADLALTAQQVHASLMAWLSGLPPRLQWSPWSVGRVAPYVLHLHMLFHTGMIILHRPPRRRQGEDAVARGEGAEVCDQSLAAILRLIGTFGRHYRFESLPLDFVHTLSAAAEVVMMRHYYSDRPASWLDRDIAVPMEQILATMEKIQGVYPCVREIREAIVERIRVDNGRQPPISADTTTTVAASGGAVGNNATIDMMLQDSEPGQEESMADIPEPAAGMDFNFDLGIIDLLQGAGGPFHSAALYPGEIQQHTHYRCPPHPADPAGMNLGFLVTDDFLNGQGHYQ